MVGSLQQVGFTKYEAEAYMALLTAGALTGYELGKRSAVPLSRSYEVLERLLQRGLALVQPGDPPRYRAESPERLLARLRADHATTLTALAAALSTRATETVPEEFWVIRGREHIMRRVATMCAAATRSIALTTAPDTSEMVRGSLIDASARGCRIAVIPDAATTPYALFLLVDEREALVGMLSPADSCQAVVSANPALVSVLAQRSPWTPALKPPESEMNWLRWEDQKRRRLLGMSDDHRAA